MSANTNTLKTEMIIRNNYLVDFRRCKSINSLLGFHSKLYTPGFNESENMVNILTINNIIVDIDIISGSYFNYFKQPVIHSFFPNVSVGIKLSKILIILFTFKRLQTRIHSITIWLTDQKRNELTLRGENLSMRFHLKEINKIS